MIRAFCCRRGVIMALFVIAAGLTQPLDVPAASAARAARYEGYSSLPYGGKVRHEDVQAVARAAAWLDALELATDALLHTAAQFGAEDPLRRKALAAAIHRPLVSIASGRGQNETENHCRVRVVLSTSARTLDIRLREALRYPDALLMRERVQRMTQDAAYEASGLALAAARAREAGDASRDEVYATRIADLAARLNALWILDESLTHLRTLWQNPAALLRELQRASVLDPSNPLVLSALGEVQLQTDQPQKALHSLDTALSLKPDLARALHARGLAHMRLRQFALAEADFDSALLYMPYNTEWLRSRGVLHMLRGQYEGMCEDFNRACALGDCEGLRSARAQQHCLPEKNTTPASPIPLSPVLLSP